MTHKITIAGVGDVGSVVVDALLQHKDEFSVVVLSRKERKDLTDKGATVIVVDYDNVDQLADAVKGSYVLMPFFNPIDKQLAVKLNTNLIQAAKRAGVKRFIPSEWSTDTTITFPGHYDSKWEVRKLLEESGLEYSLIGVGLYTAVFENYPLALDFANKKALLVEPGDQPISFIATEDIGKVAVAVLRYSYDHKLPTHINVSGEYTTWNKIVESAERALGEKFQVEYTTVDKLLEEGAQATDPFKKMMKRVVAQVLTGLWEVKPSKESSEIFKGITFTSTEDFFRKTYRK